MECANGLLYDNFWYLQCVLFEYTVINGGRRGRDRMVVGFTTTCAISAYHN